jgi:hypothetical protein
VKDSKVEGQGESRETRGGKLGKRLKVSGYRSSAGLRMKWYSDKNWKSVMTGIAATNWPAAYLVTVCGGKVWWWWTQERGAKRAEQMSGSTASSTLDLPTYALFPRPPCLASASPDRGQQLARAGQYFMSLPVHFGRLSPSRWIFQIKP